MIMLIAKAPERDALYFNFVKQILELFHFVLLICVAIISHYGNTAKCFSF